MKPFQASESTTNATKVFFFHYFLANSMNKMSSHFHRFVIICMQAYVGIHQVRILVFDFYQRCPVHLTSRADAFSPNYDHCKKYAKICALSNHPNKSIQRTKFSLLLHDVMTSVTCNMFIVVTRPPGEQNRNFW